MEKINFLAILTSPTISQKETSGKSVLEICSEKAISDSNIDESSIKKMVTKKKDKKHELSEDGMALYPNYFRNQCLSSDWGAKINNKLFSIKHNVRTTTNSDAGFSQEKITNLTDINKLMTKTNKLNIPSGEAVINNKIKPLNVSADDSNPELALKNSDKNNRENLSEKSSIHNKLNSVEPFTQELSDAVVKLPKTDLSMNTLQQSIVPHDDESVPLGSGEKTIALSHHLIAIDQHNSSIKHMADNHLPKNAQLQHQRSTQQNSKHLVNPTMESSSTGGNLTYYFNKWDGDNSVKIMLNQSQSNQVKLVPSNELVASNLEKNISSLSSNFVDHSFVEYEDRHHKQQQENDDDDAKD